jgi:hypothetical protein
LKKWECVAVGHHKNVGEVIQDWEKAGWSLHTILLLKCVQELRLFIIYCLKKASKNKIALSFFIENMMTTLYI